MKLDLKQVEATYYLNIIEQKFYNELGLVIRNCRRSKKLSQDYMTARLKISQNAYSKIGTGKSIFSVFWLIMRLASMEYLSNMIIFYVKIMPVNNKNGILNEINKALFILVLRFLFGSKVITQIKSPSPNVASG